MENEKKLTKREKFELVKGVIADYPELVEFIDGEIALIDKKREKAREKSKSGENEQLAEIVYDALVRFGKPVTASEVLADEEVANANIKSNQKSSYLLRILVNEDRVVKTVEKRKSYFSVK